MASSSGLARPRGRRSALVVVGLQKDLVTGSRAVPGAEEVLALVNTLRSSLQWDVIVRAEICHPPKHVSFLATSLKQGKDVRLGDASKLPDGNVFTLMPTYCVEGTEGAAPADGLNIGAQDHIISLGTTAGVPAMSAFRNLQSFVVGDNMTSLGKVLKAGHVTDVYVVGLGMEEVAGQTAIDAREYNFTSHLVLDACKGWDKDAVRVKQHTLEAKGVELLQSAVLLHDNDDRRSEAVAYIEANNIPVLFQQLTAELVYHKPDNPREFLIRELQKRQKQPLSELPRVSLLSDDDLSTMFNMLDPIGTQQLSGKQVMQGLKGLGMRPAEPLDPNAVFDVEQFKRVVATAN